MVVDFMPKGFNDKHWSIAHVLVTRRSIELAKRVALEFGSIIIKQCKNSSYKQISTYLYTKFSIVASKNHSDFKLKNNSSNKRNFHKSKFVKSNQVFQTLQKILKERILYLMTLKNNWYNSYDTKRKNAKKADVCFCTKLQNTENGNICILCHNLRTN